MKMREIMNRMRLAESNTGFSIGMVIVVITGSDFNAQRREYVRTAEGWCRLQSFTQRGQEFIGGGIVHTDQIGDEDLAELQTQNKVGLLKHGVRIGDRIRSVIDVEAMPEGAELEATSSIATKTFVKLAGDIWRSDDGKTAKSEHFVGMVNQSGAWVVTWIG